MPRRNKRKDYSTGRTAVFSNDGGNVGHRAECAGCAFAGYGGACTTSDGECLITRSDTDEIRETDSNAIFNR